MELKVDDITSIIALILNADWYALPLILSMLVPLVWFFLKKTLTSFEITTITETTNNNEKKAITVIAKPFLVSILEKILFFISFIAFIIGLISLKYGIEKQEVIREKALKIKAHLLDLKQISIFIDDLINKKIIENLDDLNIVIKNYPKDFITFKSVINNSNALNALAVIDTTFQRKCYESVYPLLDAFLEENLEKNKIIYIGDKPDTLVSDSCFFLQNRNNHIQNMFTYDIALSFLINSVYKEKYSLGIDTRTNEVTNNFPYIKKRGSKDTLPQ